jgi:hypothetical protein
VNKFLLCAFLTTTAFVSASDSEDTGRVRSTSRAEMFKAAFVPASSKDAAGRVRSTSRADDFLAAFKDLSISPGERKKVVSPVDVRGSVFNFDNGNSQECAASAYRATALRELGLTPASLIGSIASNLSEMEPGDSVFIRESLLNSGNPKVDNTFNVVVSALSVESECSLVPGVVFKVAGKVAKPHGVAVDYERKTLRGGRPEGVILQILSNSAFSKASKK